MARSLYYNNLKMLVKNLTLYHFINNTCDINQHFYIKNYFSKIFRTTMVTITKASLAPNLSTH